MEKLSTGLMRAMGYKTKMTKKGRDLGSDIILSHDDIGMADPRIKIEVKPKIKSKKKVSASEMRDFIEGLRNTKRGIYISTTGFSK